MDWIINYFVYSIKIKLLHSHGLTSLHVFIGIEVCDRATGKWIKTFFAAIYLLWNVLRFRKLLFADE